MPFRSISVESQKFPVIVCCSYRTWRELLAVKTIAITFQLEHQKITGARGPLAFSRQHSDTDESIKILQPRSCSGKELAM
jgi:hypothetical protein